MEELGSDAVFQFMLGLAHRPLSVYAAVVIMLTLSSFGLPVPEEVTLLSAGFIAYVGRNPELYPPPTPDALVVQPYVLAFVCTLAVFWSDVLIYWLGRRFGIPIRRSRFVRRFVSKKAWAKAEAWVERYGVRVCWVFRFTPGVRFPGHLTCGLIRVPFWQFCLADGIATLVSVPTQVLLIAFYGEVILAFLKEFKLAVATLIAVAAVGFVIWRFVLRRPSPADGGVAPTTPPP